MTTEAEDALDDLREGRGEAGLAGFRPHRVYRVTSHKGANIRDVSGQEVTEITEGSGQPPRVRWLKSEEIAVGSLASGTIEIGAITPSDELDEWLRGEGMAAGDERYLRITGPKTKGDGDLYRVTSFRAERPLRRMIQAEPVEQGFT